jgi:hypothetical protein
VEVDAILNSYSVSCVCSFCNSSGAVLVYVCFSVLAKVHLGMS